MSLHYEIEDAERKVKEARRHLIHLLTVAVVLRDGTLCHYCQVPTLLTLGGHPRRRTLDHIIPQSFGGKDDLDNLVIACQSCNAKKGNQVSQSQLCPQCRGKTLDTPAAYEVTP